MVGRRVCAIHQPNFLPRLSTLAKLFTADIWVVLDDVQFTRRDYQHRCRLADPSSIASQQWLTLPVRLPLGRATAISDVRVLEPVRTRQRVARLVQQYYGRSPHWRPLQDRLATSYLYGTGGARYLDPWPFATHGLRTEPFTAPSEGSLRIWQAAGRITALKSLTAVGPTALRNELLEHTRANDRK